MGTRDDLTPAADASALAWALAHSGLGDAALVSRAPWATTYLVRGTSGKGYLKLLPARQRAVLPTVVRLAERCPGSLPVVKAVDAAHGWLLTADHGGTTLDYDADPSELGQVLAAYAALQGAVAAAPQLADGLPVVDLARLPAQLLDFLRPDAAVDRPAGEVGAAYFIGQAEADRYLRHFSRRLPLIEAHLQAAAALRPTLEHGDLRPPNVAIRADGQPVLMDWDDAVLGPAGMSLHGCFSGCTLPTILLSGSVAAQAAADSPNGRMLHGYIDALVAAGYAKRDQLQRALPGAAFAGTIQFVLNFAPFGVEDRRDAVAGTMGARLSDLLNVCDLLAAQDRTLALALAEDYRAEGALRRAQGLLQDQVSRHPEDLQAIRLLAPVVLAQEDFAFAAELAQEALRLGAEDAAMLACLGCAEAGRLRLGPAAAAMRRAMALAPTEPSHASDLARIRSLQAWRAQAARPDQMPTLDLAQNQAWPAGLQQARIALGAELFKRWGTLQVNNVFAPELIERLQTEFFARYTPYFREDNHPDALQLGDKRYMLTVDMDDPFSDPALVGMPSLMPIIRQVMDDNFVLGAYTAAVSLPGSLDQDRHKDHPALFPDSRWHHALPCFALQVSIPLVPLNEHTGTTRVHKGSHRVSSDEAEKTPHQDPKIALGGCLMHDYRCMHLGVGNRSEQVRPILCLVFTRPWFKDFRNYDKQPPLRLSQQAYEALPEALQPLFSWWMTSLRVDKLERSVLL